MLTLDTQEARRSDNRSQVINTAGKYVGVITRAEKLTSTNGAQGLGISFKADSGASANYLDLYTHNADGKALPSYAIVNAILCCTKTRQAEDGTIEIDKWDNEAKQSYKSKVPGYPALMNKRIGLLLQEELQTNNKTGADVKRVVIYGVFDAETEFTASEILDKATKPEKLARMVSYIAEHPVNDRRSNKSAPASHAASNNPEFDDDLDF
jgi:hypothetical protein